MESNSDLRILFRADATPPIGSGDLASCVYLSEMLSKEGWDCRFLIRDYETAKEFLSRRNIDKFHVIPRDCGIEEEEREIASYVDENNISVTVFEITATKLKRYNLDRIKGRKCAVDFYNWIPSGLDMVINWDTDAIKIYDENDHQDTAFYLGPEYVLLHPDFLGCSQGESSRRRFPPKKIVVTMGGADEFDMTSKVVEGLLETAPVDFEIKVVLGAGYRAKDGLEEMCANTECDISIVENVTDMHSLYLECDYAFGAGGLTAYELVASRTPCSLIACYEHQVNRCAYFAEKGWACYLGFKDELGTIEIKESPLCPDQVFTSKVDELLQKLKSLAMKNDNNKQRKKDSVGYSGSSG